MCLPPFCSPAQRCLGCGSLRRGATIALFLNALYGLIMIVLHAYLLDEDVEVTTPGKPKLTDFGQATNRVRGKFNWFLQVVDMDLSWGHNLMGFKDDQCLLAGLLYGVAVLASCTLALSSVVGRQDDQQRLLEVGGGPGGWGRGRGAEIYRPWLPRWFVVFAHSQLIAYVFQVMTKFNKLCELRHDYFPSLEASCPVLRFQYAQRAFLGVAVSMLGLYVLGSFAYLGEEEDERTFSRSVGPRLAVLDHERPASLQQPQKVVHSSAWPPLYPISHQPVAQYSHQYQPVRGTVPSTSSSVSQCSDAATSWGIMGTSPSTQALTSSPPRQVLM